MCLPKVVLYAGYGVTLVCKPSLGSTSEFDNAATAADHANDSVVKSVYELEDFTVVAERFGEVGEFSLKSIQVLEEDEIKRQVQASLGETLSWEPGLNASYFGPGASRPVIRGLGDYRVRMLIDNIGTLDVSDNSPDHGVPLEPLLIRRVDIHRGPDALLFGNAAIGGAINSQTRYLPESLPDVPVSGSMESRYETAVDGHSAAIYGSVRAGRLALCFTGSTRSAGDYSISGQARSENYESTYSPEINEPSINLSQPIENPSGTLPNTHIDTKTHSVGVYWEPESWRGHVGVAYSRYHSEYGVPYQWEGANELFGDMSLEMMQSRVDVDVALKIDKPLCERINFRLGQADYRHEETFTGKAKDSEKVFVDTIMEMDPTEARVDLYHRLIDGLEGVVGVHGFNRSLSASQLSQAPRAGSRVNYSYNTWNLGCFLVETLTLDNFTIRAGYRHENQNIEDISQEENGFIRNAKEQSNSVAMGFTWRDYKRFALDELAFTVNVSRIERLPSEMERYAFWSNGAIQRFVLGADNFGEALGIERSNAVEFGLEAHRGDLSGRFNIYHYDFKEFIFLQDIKGTGNLSRYVARDAVFKGGEAEVTWRVHESEMSTFRVKGMIDRVRGKNLTDATNLPRIPPLRIGSRFEYERGNLKIGCDIRYAYHQDKVQAASAVVLPELETEGYYEVNLDAQNTWSFESGDLTLFARLANAIDVERRTHTSFLKDVAPLPSRNLSMGARWEF